MRFTSIDTGQFASRHIPLPPMCCRPVVSGSDVLQLWWSQNHSGCFHCHDLKPRYAPCCRLSSSGMSRRDSSGDLDVNPTPLREGSPANGSRFTRASSSTVSAANRVKQLETLFLKIHLMHHCVGKAAAPRQPPNSKGICLPCHLRWPLAGRLCRHILQTNGAPV